MATVLVTGAAGLLGAHIAALFARAHEVVGVDRHPWWGERPLRMMTRELSTPGAIADVVAAVQPDLVIHCAAMVDVDVCEQDPGRAFACNAQMSGDLARAISPECVVAYLSTDSLFKGDTPFSTEAVRLAPASVYAQSKLEGERQIRQATPNHLIVRTNFYGWSSGRKRTLAEWLYQALEAGRPVRLFTDVFFTPIYVVDLAERLSRLIESGQRGVFHLGGRERISKYEFGMLMARLAGLSTDTIMPGLIAEAGMAAPRPHDMSLGSIRREQVAGSSLPGCAEGLRRFLRDRGRPLSQRLDRDETPSTSAAIAIPSAASWGE